MEMTGQLAGIEIEDKKKNNRPAGTKVTIFLPLQK
jgi:hypothetical protein